MEIRQSAEDYLESILVLSKKGGGVRSIDIATRLGVSKPSVSHAMKLLREDGYIAMDRYGTVTLLEKGAEIANQIYERHIVLARMLEGLGVPAEIAMEDACKMEHDISEQTYAALCRHAIGKLGILSLDIGNVVLKLRVLGIGVLARLEQGGALGQAGGALVVERRCLICGVLVLCHKLTPQTKTLPRIRSQGAKTYLYAGPWSSVQSWRWCRRGSCRKA